MAKRLKRADLGDGGWSAKDTVRGYRICHHHPHVRGGTHIHVLIDGRITSGLPIETEPQAVDLMRRYARDHKEFSWAEFRERMEKMEIIIETVLTGAEQRRRILEKYGSMERLKEAARRKDVGAWDALIDIEHMEEDPSMLDETFRIRHEGELEPDELERLTGPRLHLLATLYDLQESLNVSALARMLGRDKKNVSEDLVLLEEMGLVEHVISGREKLVRPAGDEIRIMLRPAPDARRRKKAPRRRSK